MKTHMPVVQKRVIRLSLSYTTQSERCTEVHTCANEAEAQYQIDLVKQLAPIDFQCRAIWVWKAA